MSHPSWATAPLIRLSGRNVRANLTLDEGVVAFIDGEARRRRMTRTAFVESGWRVASRRRADGAGGRHVVRWTGRAAPASSGILWMQGFMQR